MEAKKEKIARIFNEAFPEDSAWNQWFFAHVFDDAQGWTLTQGGNTVSALMLMQYTLSYLGTDVPMAYIFGAATARQMRGKGYMAQLMVEALQGAYNRGDVFASLIPAHDRLYFFYDKFGFATTVFLDCERYTSVHKFVLDCDYVPAPPAYQYLMDLEQMRINGIRHTVLQYEHIIESLKMEHGDVFAVTDAKSGEPAAMAFVAPNYDYGEIEVRELLAVNPRAAESVLALAIPQFREMPIVVWAQPDGRKTSLRARAMMRLVNVSRALEIMAASAPEIDQVIRVHDNIIAANNGVFVLHRGKCQRMDATMRRITLDVNVPTLTSILFSSKHVGEVFGLNTSMASMALMME